MQAVEFGNAVHQLCAYALGLGGPTRRVARMLLVHGVCHRAAPRVTLHVLQDVSGVVVEVLRHQIGLQHLDGLRHATAVLQIRHTASQVLIERLAITQPAARQQLLARAVVVRAGDFEGVPPHVTQIIKL